MDPEENKDFSEVPQDSEMTDEWASAYGDEVPYTLPGMIKVPSITDRVIQTDPTQKNTSYFFMTQEQIFDM